ncbi:MAG TPA: PVC-type heme-binding CxxCH protein, partial [Humisphaera sp.]|nr:PVC-type heme-binding CxxCH protein [Humisphaera sp.]
MRIIPTIHRTLVLLLIPTVAAIARAEAPFDYNLYESPPKPAPAWVKMIDLGERDPALKGYRAPAGVKVEIVAHEPDVINPVAFRFAEDGSLSCLEWKVGRKIGQVDGTLTFKDGTSRPDQIWTKDVPDDMTTLLANTYGTFQKTGVVMNDLRLPSSVLFHDGWDYFTTQGSVIRRKQSHPGDGKPFDVQETLLHGLASFNQHQASGLTLSPDGWLYVTNGDDDSHAEGSDGTRADLLRNGAVWRMRPDGSQLSLFAHGFRNPYRDVAIDSFGNIFHTDNDNEDGSKFQGCRLIHVMEEADYGWRLHPGVRCCWPDHDRAAIFGELPGRMPPMVKTGRGAPCGVLLYQGVGFPEFFRGLIVYPDVFQRNVRCYAIERDGSTFKVVSQFTLLETTDGYFRPCQALQGPDGSIYLCDWRSNSAGPGAAWGDGKHGRIWRLSWEGTPEAPAIARGPMDAWVKAKTGDRATLLARLDDPDYEVRIRALDALVSGGNENLAALLQAASDTKRPLVARAAAIFGASRLWNEQVEQALIPLLNDNAFAIQKIAIEAISANAPHGNATSALLTSVVARIKTGHPAVRRAAALAAATLAKRGTADDLASVAEALLDNLKADTGADRFLHDGFIRAIERLGQPGFDRLVASAKSDGPDAVAIPALEACRSRETADAITKVLELPGINDAQAERLLVAYRYIQVEPAIDPAPISKWLDAHPTAPAPTQVAAIESLALIGAMDGSRVMPVIERLL